MGLCWNDLCILHNIRIKLSISCLGYQSLLLTELWGEKRESSWKISADVCIFCIICKVLRRETIQKFSPSLSPSRVVSLPPGGFIMHLQQVKSFNCLLHCSYSNVIMLKKNRSDNNSHPLLSVSVSVTTSQPLIFFFFFRETWNLTN